MNDDNKKAELAIVYHLQEAGPVSVVALRLIGVYFDKMDIVLAIFFDSVNLSGNALLALAVAVAMHMRLFIYSPPELIIFIASLSWRRPKSNFR